MLTLAGAVCVYDDECCEPSPLSMSEAAPFAEARLDAAVFEHINKVLITF